MKFELLNEEDKETTDFNVEDGIYVYKREEPIPHWHFITVKLSDLYERLWDGPKLSGVGFELSFRLKCRGESKPPNWSVEFVKHLPDMLFLNFAGKWPMYITPKGLNSEVQ